MKKIGIVLFLLCSFFVGHVQAGFFDFILNPFRDQEIEEWQEQCDIEEQEKSDSCGLKNLGNTCYMNALLQILHRAWGDLAQHDGVIDALHDQDFLDFRVKELKNSHDPSPHDRAEREQQLLVSLFALFKKMSTMQTSLEPREFVNAFFELVDVRKILQGDFVRKHPADSQELFEVLSEIVSDFLMYAYDKKLLTKRNLFNIHLARYGTCLVCPNGSPVVVLEAPSSFLFTQIVGESVPACLDVFFENKQFGLTDKQDNRVFCATCKKNQEGTRQYKIAALGEFLHIQLQRFDAQNQKITDPVSLSPVLDLEKYMASECKINTKYNLVGIVFHIGTSKYGHYIAAVKNKSDNKWVQYNDTKVTVLDSAQVNDMFTKGSLLGGQAYLLCYEAQA